MSEADHTRPTERLWTPWRMGYIGGETREDGCIFCNRLQRSNDIESLILYRNTNSFVIMNLYPYNTGHIMVVPNQHASDPVDLTPDTLAEIGTSLSVFTQALRRAFGCQGFNVGLNIGAIAGAGVEAHLHQHIVPRWQGDANFMPILASTMTIPELIPVTYAKIRAELTRELTGARAARFVLFSEDMQHVLLRDGMIPVAETHHGQPLVQAIVSALPEGVMDARLIGWAGPDAAPDPRPDDIALTLTGNAAGMLPSPWAFQSCDDEQFDDETAAMIARARNQIAPSK
jgi:ATP adenylyltransferase